MKRLILHAGMHKTGTTAIQSIAAKNRDDLYAKGVYYPKSWEFFGNLVQLPSANAHFSLFNALVDMRTRDKRQLEQFSKHLRDDIPDDFTILISAESLNRHVVSEANTFADGHRAFLERVAEYFEGFHTEVVVYFRRPSDFAESMFSEAAVSSPGYANFRKIPKRYIERFQYRYLKESYAVHFPISCQSFEAQKSNLGTRFWKAIGLPQPVDTTETTRRPSVPKAAVRWIFRAKRDLGNKMERPERVRRWLFGLQHENAKLFRSDIKTSFWEDLADSRAFHERMVEGFDDLTFERPTNLPPRCSWSARDHERAEARFEEWQVERADWLKERAKKRIPAFIESQAPKA